VPFAAGTEREVSGRGGKMKPRRGPTRFSSPENSKFFCWTDVDDATSALDGRGMDA
jgi:hypothetical protein